MKFILLFLLAIVSCKDDTRKISILNHSNQDSFISIVDSMVYKRYLNYENEIDKFVIEQKFQNELCFGVPIRCFTGKIFTNSYDTSRQRRELFFISDNAWFYYAIANDNSYTQSLKLWDSVEVSGWVFGALFKSDEKPPQFDPPEFVGKFDTVKIISRK